MTWVFVILAAVVAFGLAAFVFKAPRGGWEAIGAALLLGIAGYAWQAQPSLPGAPKQPAVEVKDQSSSELVAARKALSAQGSAQGSDWLVIADALARHGQFQDAAGVLLGAVEKNPKDGEAWLALANALVGHAEGNLSPAALFAFQQASAAAPEQPGPPFFLGLALAQSGRLAEARTQWADLLARTPPDAPWREDLAVRLARLDQFIAAQETAGKPR